MAFENLFLIDSDLIVISLSGEDVQMEVEKTSIRKAFMDIFSHFLGIYT